MADINAFALILSLLLIHLVVYINAARNFDILINSAEFTIHDHETLPFGELTLPMYKGHKSIHFEFELGKPLKTFKIKLTVHAARQKIPLVELTANGCDILADNEQSQLVKVIAQAIRVDSKLPERCPVEANKRYVIEHFYMNPEDFPSFTPLMNVFANVSIIAEKKILFSFFVNAEFKKL